MLHAFTQFFVERGLSLTGGRYLLAVSGGLDSVVLCALSRRAGMNVAFAHCNFGLRGEESARDETFVRHLADAYAVPVFVQRFDTAAIAQAQKISVQEAARTLRYDWFARLRKEQGFAYTLLAHHADDNIETLLFHFFRGTGLEGLTGMPAVNKEAGCLRPMLTLRRKEIEAFAKANGLAWVEDSSNSESHYTRNFLRNEVLPRLRTVFPAVDDNLLHNISRLQQAAVLYKDAVDGLKKKLGEVKGEELHIPVLKLLRYKHTPIVYELIREFGFGEGAVGEVLKLTAAESGRYMANERYRIIRHRRWLIIAPVAVTAQTLVVDKHAGQVLFADKALHLKTIAADRFRLDPSPLVAQLDASEVAFPLVLRKWKAGDYFYPLGLRKKKKLARFFIDLKLSKTEKEKLWVLESHKRIVWVVGYRIDDRFKVGKGTATVLHISLSNPSPAGTTVSA